MGAERPDEPGPNAWAPFPDPPGRYSSGIPDLDRLLGGGPLRGSLALIETDADVTVEDRDLLLTPLFLNFLHQSRGIIAVLPAADSPHGFRARLTRFTTRRRFDRRVRVIEYAGEDDERPYVVSLAGLSAKSPPAARKRGMEKMAAAERAAQGERRRSFLEFNAFEVLETVVGPEQATRMFFFGVKRARAVGNLVVGILRPGLACADAVRSMADSVLAVSHDDGHLLLRGQRPEFPAHRVVPDPARSRPNVALVPQG